MMRISIPIVVGIAFSMQCTSKIDDAKWDPPPPCPCDSACLWKIVMDPMFGAMPADSLDNIYGLTREECRSLWFRDIESPDTSKFTRQFNSYFASSYYADNRDFASYYKGRKDIPLAFQLGPNMDLWAFHSFVARSIDSCYLLTHSYYRHARFTMKEFAFLDRAGLDTLRTRLYALKSTSQDTSWYSLVVSDNAHNEQFFAGMGNREDVDSLVQKLRNQLYDHLDKVIAWRKSY
jgi:hypothetical protein